MNRRTVLATVGVVGAGFAGCLEDTETVSDDGSGDTDDGAAGDTDNGGSSENDAAVEAVSVEQFGYTHSTPEWVDGTPADHAGHVLVITSMEAARNAPQWDELGDDRRAELEAFVEEIDFDSSVLLLVEATAPDSSYQEIEIDDVAVDDGAVRGSALAEQTQEGGDDALAIVSALARVEFDGEPFEEAVFHVENGWGDVEEIHGVLAEENDDDAGDNGDSTDGTPLQVANRTDEEVMVGVDARLDGDAVASGQFDVPADSIEEIGDLEDDEGELIVDANIDGGGDGVVEEFDLATEDEFGAAEVQVQREESVQIELLYDDSPG